MNAEQLKGKIRYYSQQTKLPPQEILQMYLFERILERMSASKYSNNFILRRWAFDFVDAWNCGTFNDGYGRYCKRYQYG